jgi:hypothetical protein
MNKKGGSLLMYGDEGGEGGGKSKEMEGKEGKETRCQEWK